MSVTDRAQVEQWVARYERAWRAPGTEPLAKLFSPDVTYRPSPWREPLVGLAAVQSFWERARDGADEGFRITSDIVAVDGPAAVVRVAVDYDDGARWRDLWVVTFDARGRCNAFEEWPFAPGQLDGHESEGAGSDRSGG